MRYRGALGREIAPKLAIAAANHLHEAGRRAIARGDGGAARSLLERALALAPDTDRLHSTIAVDLAEELLQDGVLARVDQLLAVAERDPDLASDAAPVRLEWLLRTRPREATATIEVLLPELLERLKLAGDERGLAKAHLTAWSVRWLSSHATLAAQEARLAAEHARRAGDERLRTRALVGLGGALCWGAAPVSVLAAHIDSVEHEDPGPLLSAFQFVGRAWLARYEGQFEQAVAHAERGAELVGALQKTQGETMHQLVAGLQLVAGNPEAALTAIRRADAPLAAEGERARRSTTQAMLAEICEALGDREGALAAADLSDELSADEDVINWAITHRVRARIASADGDLEGAERWARSAVEYAFMSDFAVHRSATKLELARVLAAGGRTAEAQAAAREALAIAIAKGDKPAVARAEAML